MKSRPYLWSALGLSALLFLFLNLFANNFFLDTRLDLTKSQQYTLSDGTRAIIAKLPEQVTLRFYFSRKNATDYPATTAYAKRVRDLLGHYVAMSKGKIVLEDVDPEPFTPEEDRAVEDGMKPAPVQSGGAVYFGLEGSNSLDYKNAIPYFAPEREPYLEYDLTALLYQLSHPGKPKVAVLSQLPLTNAPGTPGQPLGLYAELQRDYDLVTLKDDFAAIPPDTSLLLIAHPQAIQPAQLRMIEMYVLKGGRALIFIDPLSELVQREQRPGAPPSSDLVALLKGWGVDYTPTKVVLDGDSAQRIRNPADPQRATTPYPLWLHLTAPNFSKADPVTASLTGVNLASAGALSRTKGATTKFEPLLFSSPNASLYDRNDTLTLKDPGALTAAIRPGGKPLTLAARITGRAVFPGVTQGNINIVVVADTDIWDDRFWLDNSDPNGGGVPFADNEGFVLNAVESLTGSDDLISLRARGNVDHPFTRVRQMQAAAESQFRETLDALRGRLASSQSELAQLQQGGQQTALTPQQSASMERVRREIAATRSQLRDVQHNLNAEIDRLGSLLAFLNIAGVPLLVAGFGIVFGLIRRRRAQGRAKRPLMKTGGA
jgi:ABC-type uncharacterized transport system involved in gliding motility auxiliary subunit